MAKDTPKLVKTNEWRVTKMCGNCPFKDDGKAIHLRAGRVDDIKKQLESGESFSCHKTVYNLDVDMNPTEEQPLKMCAGAYEYLKKINKPNQIMQVAERFGYE